MYASSTSSRLWFTENQPLIFYFPPGVHVYSSADSTRRDDVLTVRLGGQRLPRLPRLLMRPVGSADVRVEKVPPSRSSSRGLEFREDQAMYQ